MFFCNSLLQRSYKVLGVTKFYVILAAYFPNTKLKYFVSLVKQCLQDTGFLTDKNDVNLHFNNVKELYVFRNTFS